MQLMSSGKKVDSRQQEVADITRTMKIAAKELDVPILLLSQMSREVEKRNTKEPQMSDLRESGAIEVEIHIAKHRNGSTGKVPLRWRGSFVSFEDIDTNPETDDAPPAPEEDVRTKMNIGSGSMEEILKSSESDDDII